MKSCITTHYILKIYEATTESSSDPLVILEKLFKKNPQTPKNSWRFVPVRVARGCLVASCMIFYLGPQKPFYWFFGEQNNSKIEQLVKMIHLENINHLKLYCLSSSSQFRQLHVFIRHWLLLLQSLLGEEAALH